MKDTVYLAYGPDGVKNMTKTKPRKNHQYVKVTIEVPDPPAVAVTVPAASATVEATNYVEPDWVDGEIWCSAHGHTHEADEEYSDHEHCTPAHWQRIAREPLFPHGGPS